MMYADSDSWLLPLQAVSQVAEGEKARIKLFARVNDALESGELQTYTWPLVSKPPGLIEILGAEVASTWITPAPHIYRVDFLKWCDEIGFPIPERLRPLLMEESFEEATPRIRPVSVKTAPDRSQGIGEQPTHASEEEMRAQLLNGEPQRYVTWQTHAEGSADATTPNSANVFHRQGDFWEVQFKGKKFSLKHSIGCAHLEALLSSPNEVFDAKQLREAESGESIPSPSRDDDVILDGQEKRQLVKREQALPEEIRLLREAGYTPETSTDLSEFEDELAFVREELNRTTWAGQSKSFRTEAYRHRKAVSSALTTAYSKIREYDPQLERYLRANIMRKGGFVFRPAQDDPGWQII